MEKRVSQTDESTDVRSSIARLRQILDEPRSPEDKAQLLRTVLDEVADVELDEDESRSSGLVDSRVQELGRAATP